VIDKAGIQDSGLFFATAGRVIHCVARRPKEAVRCFLSRVAPVTQAKN
jgi:hypothetical protein